MNKTLFAALGLGISMSCFAGDMGTIQKTGGFYLQGMLDYNWFNYDYASTASYFGPKGINPLASSISNQWGYGLGVGYRFNDYVRVAATAQARPDVRFSVTDNAPETARGHFDNYTYLFNAYLSSPELSFGNISPYIMGGIGGSHNKTNAIFWPLAVQTEFSDKTNQFAWQAGAGALYALTDAWLVDANFTVVSLGKVSNSGQYNAVAANGVPASGSPTRFNRVYSNQIEAGVHYRFNA